jgi:hypothetical protein
METASYSIKKYSSEYTEWRNKQGQWHREGAPARKWANGSKQWWVNGKCHRIDGPAREWPGDYIEWWVNDCYIKVY